MKQELGPLADTLAGIDMLELVLWFGGLVTLIAIMSRVYKVVRPRLRAIEQFLDDWQGDPGRPEVGILPRKGVMERLKDHEDGLAEVRTQVTPNHNSQKSLAVEIQDGMAELSGRVENIERFLGLITDAPPSNRDDERTVP